jgi:dUTP pyrophosphatase
MKAIFERTNPLAYLPTRATAGSAGYDLRACLIDGEVRVVRPEGKFEKIYPLRGFSLNPNERARIPLGFRCQMEPGYEAQIRSRSGMTLKHGLVVLNSPGTIDADYPDEWMVILANLSRCSVPIEHGQPIAQAVFHRYEVVEFEYGEVGVTTQRTGGFGSTG